MKKIEFSIFPNTENYIFIKNSIKTFLNFNKIDNNKILTIINEIIANIFEHTKTINISNLIYITIILNDNITIIIKHKAPKYNVNINNIGKFKNKYSGAGIFLVKSISKNLFYEHKNNYNILKVII